MNTSKDNKSLISLYLVSLAFDATRQIRQHHKISFNLILVLINMYEYSRLVCNTFSASAIQKFIHIYEYNRVRKYFNTLLSIGLIVEDHKKNTFQYYKLTNQAIDIINEIPLSYNRVMYEFCNKYNVVL